jgi:hypothetical protein
VSNAAVRADYSNYRNGQASSAAFFKAGRWLVKLRVSGPEARQHEVESAMAALLAGTRIGKNLKVYPAAPVTMTPCAIGEGETGAHMLPDPSTGETMGEALLAVLDGAGSETKKQHGSGTTILHSRAPTSFCRSNEVKIGDDLVPVFRSAAAKTTDPDERTRLIVVLGDGGSMLEAVEVPGSKRYILFHHAIAGTSLLPGWDGIPSDAQIGAIISGGDTEATRIRGTVRLRPGKGDEISIDTDPQPAKPTT